MNMRLILLTLTSLVLITGCGGGSKSDSAVPAPPATNNGGSVVTGILTARFDPSNAILPFPISLLLSGTTDLTINIPVADPTNFGDPTVALNALDGFGTVTPWTASFVNEDGAAGSIDPASVVPGGSVRMFEVTTVTGTPIVSGVVGELVPGVDFVATVSGSSVAIIPLRPLKELTNYMAVLTEGIKDTAGNDATPDQAYFIGKRTSPLVDASGNSTDPLLPNATAAALEPLRQIINAQEAAAASVGISPDSIILSWAAQTQSITPVLNVIRSTISAAPTTIGFSGLSTAAAVPGAAGIADIYSGVITLPYYQGVPTVDDPTAPLTNFWTATPGAYVPPFDALGLDPTSTHVTVANPIPVVTSMQTVPVLMTVPNATSGMTKPASGWPVVIYQHGITRNRTDLLAIAETLASIGYVVIGIDQPLHGVVPDVDPGLAAFYIDAPGSPFAPIANERTFDLDLVNNATGAPGPDGVTDSSGTHTIQLTSLLTSRDNLRQASADLSVLTVTIPTISIDGDAIPDLDGSNVSFVGQSLGSIVGTAFLGVEGPRMTIRSATLSVPGGGIAKMLEASESFGPSIRAGLQAGAGLEPGTPDFEQFFLVAQTVIDSGDPINWAGVTAASNKIMLHEVIGDAVIPNAVATAPLSGTEPLIRIMGLDSINATTTDPAGLGVALRYVPPASHGSLLNPADSAAATVEMQKQMASMVASFGTTVVVADPSVLVSP